MHADDLVLLSPTEHQLQQNLSLLETYCQNWGMNINLKKIIILFQKKARSQGSRCKFSVGETTLQQIMTYNYLGIIISASGRFDIAINALTDKARRAYCSIRRSKG